MAGGRRGSGSDHGRGGKGGSTGAWCTGNGVDGNVIWKSEGGSGLRQWHGGGPEGVEWYAIGEQMSGGRVCGSEEGDSVAEEQERVAWSGLWGETWWVNVSDGCRAGL